MAQIAGVVGRLSKNHFVKYEGQNTIINFCKKFFNTLSVIVEIIFDSRSKSAYNPLGIEASFFKTSKYERYEKWIIGGKSAGFCRRWSCSL